MKKVTLFLSVLILAACGKGPVVDQSGNLPVGFDLSNAVVRSRVVIPVAVGSQRIYYATTDQGQSVTVTNAPSTSMNIDASKFNPPTITNSVLNFGTLTVSSLLDNNLKVCGTSGNQQCGTALLRIYTTGVAGAGLWNSVDGYGAPITASLTTPLSVGLNVAGAAVLQTISLPSTKHVVSLSDFTSPSVDISVDFTQAGAGTYTTTVVMEYALST